MWNIVVVDEMRGKGVGKALVEYYRPRTIRVKSSPIGHLSNKQKEQFIDPTEFYEKMGYKFWGNDVAHNFWQKGEGGKGQFHIDGDVAHIKIYKDDGTTLFD